MLDASLVVRDLHPAGSQWPAEKIFDEIYYARAGEEYLRHVEIFEFTHPPLTKLIVTLSMMLFGGLHGLGDTGLGWRFLNVVVGALMVGRALRSSPNGMTGSTLFAAVAAGMLLFDGFHFVQSRIATPEITVAFFSLSDALRVLSRLDGQRGAARRSAAGPVPATLAIFAAFLIVGALIAGAGWRRCWSTLGPQHAAAASCSRVAWVVAFLYVEIVFYLAARWVPSRRRRAHVVASYADGSRVESTRWSAATRLAGRRAARAAAARSATSSCGARDERAVRSTCATAGSCTRRPAGRATFEPDGDDEGRRRIDRAAARCGAGSAGSRFASGALAASKWNGLFDFFVVWFCAAAVVAQRFLRRPALFGNPFGMPLDVLVGVMLVVGGAIYTLCYIPFFTLGHNFLDMVALQTEMFNYHDHLVATHPYASSWWQWPILERPISYFYHDYRTGAAANDPAACCVAEILALPNPFVWWFGLITVPVVGGAGLVRAQPRLRAADRRVLLAVAALDRLAAHRVRIPFLPEPRDHRAGNAIVLQKLWHWVPAGAASPMPAHRRRHLSRHRASGPSSFFYPVLAGHARDLGRLARPHVDRPLDHLMKAMVMERAQKPGMSEHRSR